MGDPNREMRAMILCATPFPPLPVVARRFLEGNSVGDNAVVTSHDILSHLLEDACVKKTAEEHAVRRDLQVKVLGDFILELLQTPQDNPEKLYETYCNHTRKYIATYVQGKEIPELFFMPLSYCCKGDYTHRRFCDYMTGQSIMRELPQSPWAQMDFHTLLQEAKKRTQSLNFEV